MYAPFQNRRIFLGLLAAGVLAGLVIVGFSVSPPSLAVEEPVDIPDIPDPFAMPGVVEDTGTHFEITDSDYLNITLDSSEEIELRMESIPEMITMLIEPDDSVTATHITITGFDPATTYYKFEDNYHNMVAFTTDSNGTYGYAQNISNPHFVFIQPRTSTKFIADNATGGDCTTIGIWDSNTKTCTLTTDLNETIQIDSNGITLDGDGHTITGNNTGFGVVPSFSTGVTVKNLTVRNFSAGVIFFFSNNDVFTGNRFEANGIFGVVIISSNGLIFNNNIVSNNGFIGVAIIRSNGNTVTDNTVQENGLVDIQITLSADQDCNNDIRNNTGSGGRPIQYVNSQVNLENRLLSELILCNADGSTVNNVVIKGSATKKNNGIILIRTSSATITNTTSSNNATGITLISSDNNTVVDNSFSSNVDNGILLFGATNNVVTRNVLSSNASGIRMRTSSGNTLTGNTISSNEFSGILIGIFSNNNTVTLNTISSNRFLGIFIFASSNDNRVFQNNFIDNPTQAADIENNIFNLAKPVGGNFWSNYDTPAEGCNDVNGDGFCDAPFVFRDGQDDFPWTVQDGWLGPRLVNVELSWSANEDPDFESYRIFRDTDSQVELTDTQVGPPITEQTEASFVDENLETGQTFFYRVFVFDQAGLSTGSDVEEVETTLP